MKITLLSFVILSTLFMPGFVNGLDNAAQPLDLDGDLAMQMVDGIDCYLMNAIDANVQRRNANLPFDTSSEAEYLNAIQPKRVLLMQRLALIDKRETVSMQWIGEVNHVDTSSIQNNAALIAESERYFIYEVKWNVFRQIESAGLLLVPKGKISAAVIAIPDANQTPEEIARLVSENPQTTPFAEMLVTHQCMVLIPTLINREDTYSGVPDIRMTNQPHREYLWRAAYEMGRTVIGYEMQKVLAAVDWIDVTMPNMPVGIAGYGEGGLLAMYTVAVDQRIDAALVSGYFPESEHLWQQPIDRNIWSLRRDFGGAEIAALIAPRKLIIEASQHPQFNVPPQTQNRSGAAPGKIITPEIQSVRDEFNRAVQMIPNKNAFQLIENTSLPMGNDALQAFLSGLNLDDEIQSEENQVKIIKSTNPEQRHQLQFEQILEDTQYLMRESEFTRKTFWADADTSSAEAWETSSAKYKDYFWEHIIGKLPKPDMPINPRYKKLFDEPNYTGYQVVLDVYPGVFAYGILLLPKDIKPGERRPVVVCQHGLEGRPTDVADPKLDHPAYHQYACRLADGGFITFSPQNPYIGEERFRVLLRKGQPLGLTLFSFIVRQHERIIEWLAEQPHVDGDRIAFYGLSYGGKTAMRIPVLLDGYCLSICSADYNEWIWKNVSARHKYSYLLTGEYDMPEYDLGNTFNYAEMSWMIFPRPFMVERGHHDGVAPSEWVAYEFARTQQHYDVMGLSDKTEIEFFNGPHTINGVGTFAFLHKHLNF